MWPRRQTTILGNAREERFKLHQEFAALRNFNPADVRVGSMAVDLDVLAYVCYTPEQRTSVCRPELGRKCHSEAVDYSIRAAGSPSGGPNARHNSTATRYQKPSHPHRLFRRTIPDERRIRPYHDENRGLQRSLALSGFVGEHVFGPHVQGPRALLGEIVTLVDGGDTPELRRLVGRGACRWRSCRSPAGRASRRRSAAGRAGAKGRAGRIPQLRRPRPWHAPQRPPLESGTP